MAQVYHSNSIAKQEWNSDDFGSKGVKEPRFSENVSAHKCYYLSLVARVRVS